MILIFIYFISYILIGSVVTMLAAYVGDYDFLINDISSILAVLFWPVISLPLLAIGVIKKVFDKIFED